MKNGKDRNVYENVAFAQKVIGTPARLIRSSVPTMLSMVGLAAKYKSYPKQLVEFPHHYQILLMSGCL